MARLFVEADGVLMDHVDINRPKEMLHPDYFKLRLPEWNMLHALRTLIKRMPQLEVYVICQLPLCMEESQADIADWFSLYLPEATALRYLPIGEYFGSYIAVKKGDVLLSADVGSLAVFAFGGCVAIGVDTDTAAVPGLPYITTWEHGDYLANWFLEFYGEATCERR